MRPLLSAIALMLLAVESVTQPPQTNPITIVATPPKAIPWRKRVRASPCKIAGIFMTVSFTSAPDHSRADAVCICTWKIKPKLLDCAFRWRCRRCYGEQLHIQLQGDHCHLIVQQ